MIPNFLLPAAFCLILQNIASESMSPALANKLTALGLARAQFGDPPGDSGDYRYFSTSFGVEPTEMYFPFGVSNVRYYINFANITVQRKTTSTKSTLEETLQPYLVKEIQAKGSVKVSWVLKLNRNGESEAIFPPPASYGQMGTLEYLLQKRGLYPNGPAVEAKNISKDLKEISPLAGYRVSDNHNLYFWFWAVDEFGNYGPSTEFNYRDLLPKSNTPYPISEAEKRFLQHPSASR